ncbi:hypothetical protein KEM09_04080 [Carboxylicivirga mesophila]|uniref:Uncharacterized protein n=1 Tax=Carboxylicivirga mesophila TaxID=1166478 RepID=A0ABS5K6E5_9BACT|nr:hypothetical protein [Carboxylicivirga mesophila]MBS2210564.1 hypothetical protein [Carboxylicivirga mesophila]
MRITKALWCKNLSDKDFIFDIFQNNGFLPNANTLPESSNLSDNRAELESESANNTEPEQ